MAMYRSQHPPPPPPSKAALCPSCLTPHFPFCSTDRPFLHPPFAAPFSGPGFDSAIRNNFAGGRPLLPPPLPPQILQHPHPPHFPPAEALLSYNPMPTYESRIFPGHDYLPERTPSTLGSHRTNRWIGGVVERGITQQSFHGALGIDSQRDLGRGSKFGDRIGESGILSRTMNFAFHEHEIGIPGRRPDDSTEDPRLKRQKFEGGNSACLSKNTSLPLLPVVKHEELESDYRLLKRNPGHKAEDNFPSSEKCLQQTQEGKKEMLSEAPTGVGEEKVRSWDLESGSSDSSQEKEASKHIENYQIMPDMHVLGDNPNITSPFEQHRKKPPSREEELRIEHGLQTSGMSREDQLLVERALQSTYSRRLDPRPWVQQTFHEHSLRERTMSWRESEKQPGDYDLLGKQQRLSREEELLIEKGLLDDNSRDGHGSLLSINQSHPSDVWLSLKDRGKLQGHHELSSIEATEGHHPSRFYGDRCSEMLMITQNEQLAAFENSERHLSSGGWLNTGMKPSVGIGNLGALQQSSRDRTGLQRCDDAMERTSLEAIQSRRGDKLNTERDIYSHDSSVSRDSVPTDRNWRPPLVENQAPVQVAERHFAEAGSQQRAIFQQQNLDLRAGKHHTTPLNPLREVSQEVQEQQHLGLQQTFLSDPVYQPKEFHLQRRSQIQQHKQKQAPWQELFKELPETNQEMSEALCKSNILQQSSIPQVPRLNGRAYLASERNSRLSQRIPSQDGSHFSWESEFGQHGNESKQAHSEFPVQHQPRHNYQDEISNKSATSALQTVSRQLPSHQCQLPSHQCRNGIDEVHLEKFHLEQSSMHHQRKPEQQEAHQVDHWQNVEQQMQRLQHFPSQEQSNAQLQQPRSFLQTKRMILQQTVHNFSQQMQDKRQQNRYYSLISGQPESFQSMGQTVMTSDASHDALLVSTRLPNTSENDAADRQVFPFPRLQQSTGQDQNVQNFAPSRFTAMGPPLPSSSRSVSASSAPVLPLAHASFLPPSQAAVPPAAIPEPNAPLLLATPAAQSTPEQKVHKQSFQVQKQSSFSRQNPFSVIQPGSQVQEKSRTVDAVNIFKKPGRLIRPDRFVVILRGLPGSGKSYLAKELRDVEVSNGGSAPRIHSIDDYFMTEVEKAEDDEPGKSTMWSKKKVVKKVMEYCYEPEMEEAYRASMFKAFRKTLEEGLFTFVIVDDRNILVADFAQFWATAKRSGYEVYMLEAPYKDPLGCAARNVHGFTVEQVQSMADRWELTPSIYYKLDISSLFQGDDLNAEQITEVEMDADDMECDAGGQETDFRQFGSEEHSPSSNSIKTVEKKTFGGRWDDEEIDNGFEIVQDELLVQHNQADDHEGGICNSGEAHIDAGNALSGLMKAYGKREKSVRWADLEGGTGSNKGFSIGAIKRRLVIGPGSGYNENSNPWEEEQDVPHTNQGADIVKRNMKFLEQLRAEQEAFKADFARRRHRISGMDEEDD